MYRDVLKVVRCHAKGDHLAGFVSQEFRKNTALKDLTDVRHRIGFGERLLVSCAKRARSQGSALRGMLNGSLRFFLDRGTVDVLWVFLLVITIHE